MALNRIIGKGIEKTRKKGKFARLFLYPCYYRDIDVIIVTSKVER